MKEKVQSALNKQVNWELYSSNLYLSMSAYFQSINLAAGEGDHATNIFLQWFVTEQVEEEASADAVVQKLKLMGDASGGLFMLDREMGQRVFTPPAASAEG